MPLVNMKTLLTRAKINHHGVGAFNVGNMEMVLGAIKAAEDTNTPIIIQIAESRFKHSPLYLMGPMMVAAAKKAKVDVAVHLDHGQTFDAVKEALALGFTSVMFDGSSLPYEENIAKTKEVVMMAKKYGASVESELGHVGGSEDGSQEIKALYTDPSKALDFVNQTGVDFLAVAIGNAHGVYKEKPKLAFDVLDQIASTVSIPLVLHGGSGISDDEFVKLIKHGISKVNIATASFIRLTQEAEAYLKNADKHNYFDLNLAMVKGTYLNVKHHIEVFNR
ncbi:MAG: class II aldolase [Bacilli bacterium]|nr:class II aldolase [Bacilli bacterium]